MKRKPLSIVLTGTALAAVLAGCSKPQQAPPPPDVVVAAADTLPVDPSDDAWNQAPEHVAGLILQDLVDPRLMEASTAELRVRALTDGTRVAVRLQWTDATEDDLATPDTFTDACAIQLPPTIAPDIPAPQMGEPGRPVRITYWSAAWQAAVEGRGDSLKDLYPNASIDHYPFEAQSLKADSPEQQAMATRYAPARAMGNFMAGPRDKPVQDLIAEGPGTLTAAPATTSDGLGQRTEDGWSVVIIRSLPEGFGTAVPAQIAFAVWDGSHAEVGARKMRTAWINLTQQVAP